MGRITVWSLEGCKHCTRAKSALAKRCIPYSEISLSTHPSKRRDMLSISNKLSVPQVFFNEDHIGGADETLAELARWDEDKKYSTPLERYREEIEARPEPTDPRLKLPTSKPIVEKPPPPRDELNSIELPNKSKTSVLDITLKLCEILPIGTLKWNLTEYKNCFVGSDCVDILMKNFDINSREEAVRFGKLLHRKKIIRHVVDDHDFKDEHLYYRIQPNVSPDILNSFCVWTERVDPDAMGLLKRLQSQLVSIESRSTSETGEIDYVGVRQDPFYPVFEEAACELQGIDIGKMDNDDMKLAFGINLYNLMIKYAFIKLGIPKNAQSRGAFFSSVKFNVGGDILSFNDLEHGILRGNRKPPYSFSVPFSSDDPRSRLSLTDVDCRIHFALNCGAKSCPPVKYFSAEAIHEELRIVSEAFVEHEESVALDEAKNIIYLTKIVSWYRTDFIDAPQDSLPEKILPFLRGEKRETLQRMISSKKPIMIKFNPYDWSTNASRSDTYVKNVRNNNFGRGFDPKETCLVKSFTPGPPKRRLSLQQTEGKGAYIKV